MIIWFCPLPQLPCKIMAVLLHFFFLSAFAWMLVEGLHLYSMVVKVFGSEGSKHIYYYGIGWGRSDQQFLNTRLRWKSQMMNRQYIQKYNKTLSCLFLCHFLIPPFSICHFILLSPISPSVQAQASCQAITTINDLAFLSNLTGQILSIQCK